MTTDRIPYSLPAHEARLVFLAIAYHLGRPGSELDPMTKQPVKHGLAEVARDLQPQLRSATATVTLDADQARRLLSAMNGAITELKAYPMLQLRREGGRLSTVPGFDGTLRHLFPEVEEDVEHALEVAERMVMLRRRLGQAAGPRRDVLDAELQPGAARDGRPWKWWPFGR